MIHFTIQIAFLFLWIYAIEVHTLRVGYINIADWRGISYNYEDYGPNLPDFVIKR